MVRTTTAIPSFAPREVERVAGSAHALVNFRTLPGQTSCPD
jgi:hypothetical protein